MYGSLRPFRLSIPFKYILKETNALCPAEESLDCGQRGEAGRRAVRGPRGSSMGRVMFCLLRSSCRQGVHSRNAPKVKRSKAQCLWHFFSDILSTVLQQLRLIQEAQENGVVSTENVPVAKPIGVPETLSSAKSRCLQSVKPFLDRSSLFRSQG